MNAGVTKLEQPSGARRLALFAVKKTAIGSLAVGSQAIGVLAVGALAIGALAIGRLCSNVLLSIFRTSAHSISMISTSSGCVSASW